MPKRLSVKTETSVIQGITDTLLPTIQLRDLYTEVFFNLMLFMFYFVVMSIQFQTYVSYTTSTAVAAQALPPKNGVEFMEWLQAMVLDVWNDPECGDNVCQPPVEFASYGRFGCKSDCGEDPEVSTVVLYFQVDFQMTENQSRVR
ncbi:hypothetical protein CYMTET_41044 [Cymbomonas tetramitiformis]|uniref:Uncharacterized protein n=1 Tax=Cymbomonas tetramitiformis TaxID=36881 RepID=A0AAE0C7X9_9CHLO|nr:hypothetical protein CYMTET_41044 [Cymbomonas tetramitiformis]